MTHSWPIEIGSQLFINKRDEPARIKAWVRQMHECNLHIIRLFMLWDNLEPQEGKWYFDQYDACFAEAEALGLKVVPTLMAEAPPGWMKLTERAQSSTETNDPVYWQRALEYISCIVDRYHRSPALHSWILMNEPARGLGPNVHVLDKYKNYLRNIYSNNIALLNRQYFKQYDSFEDAVDPQSFTRINPLAYTESLDWVRFTVANLMEKLMDIKAAVRQIDEEHMVHVNPAGLAWVNTCMWAMGQSVWEEAKIVDFLGCSCHPSANANRISKDRVNDFIAFSADMMRSATPHEDGLFWISELQGGTTLFTVYRYFTPSADDIRQWMWESIGSGAKGIVFWCFNTRDHGIEGAEWGLLNHAGKPSKRLLAAGEVAAFLDLHRDVFATARPPEPDVWILYSEATCALGCHENSIWGNLTQDKAKMEDTENPRNIHMGLDAIFGAYLIMRDLGLQVGFIDEEKLQKRPVKKGDILIVPHALALSAETCRAIEEFAAAGGDVIADGMCGLKDANGNISEANKAILDKLFGAELLEIEALEDGSTIMLQGGATFPGWFAKCSFECGEAEVLGWHDDGQAAVVRRKAGRGSALRIGTVLFQRYVSNPLLGVLEVMKGLLHPIKQRRAALAGLEADVRLKILNYGEAEILILINRAGSRKVALSFAEPGELVALEGMERQSFSQGSTLQITMEAHGVMVFKAVYVGNAALEWQAMQ